MKDRDWTAFTQAEWTLEMKIARYSELISAERNSARPNQARIDVWLEMQASADDLLDQVSFMGPDKVTALLEESKREKQTPGNEPPFT